MLVQVPERARKNADHAVQLFSYAGDGDAAEFGRHRRGRAHRPMNIVAIRTAFADAWAFATRPLSTLLVGTRKI